MTREEIRDYHAFIRQEQMQRELAKMHGIYEMRVHVQGERRTVPMHIHRHDGKVTAMVAQ